METVYYTLDVRPVNCCDMASGEALPRYVIRPKLRAEEPFPGDMGKVLDFAACRRALEGQEALCAEGDTPAGEEAHAPSSSPRRRAGAELILDLLATGAVLAMAAAVILAFLPLL